MTMNVDGTVSVYASLGADCPSEMAPRDSPWSDKVIVVVLTVMKPSRLTRKTVLKAVILTALLTTMSCFFLLSFSAERLHPTITKARPGSPQQTGRRKLKFTAKENKLLRSGAEAVVRDVGDSGQVWDISSFKDDGDITPVCQTSANLLILITSAPENVKRRDAIRKSWCSFKTMGFLSRPWQCVFMIGRTDNQTLSSHVQEESKNYRDILQGSYKDTYRNLTLKVIHGFDWAASNCQQLQYLLKTDDDCFVNTGILHHFLVKYNKVVFNLYVGNVFSAEDKRTVVRHPQSRWFVSFKDYDASTYPRYASGTGYLMSYDILQRIVNISKFVRPFPVEDAYVGFLINKLGIEPIASTRFTLYGQGWSTCNYLYLMVIHGVEASRQLNMAEKFLEASSGKCKLDSSEMRWR